MVLFAVLVALAVLGIFAVVLGVDTREGFRR
jgi:hypothetical protein